ncbi:MAG: NUDIX domain-containing protein [Candidatus Aenigmarchaeota archaeon]|nr:NUDIX domain-containing protein [Candidatus Aenigmarchaeota archaeon]
MGFKKMGFGKGKFNGFGGKVRDNETVEEAALRELQEETGIRALPDDIRKVAELEFEFPSVPKENGWDQRVHVFLVEKWEGEASETEEMRPVWINIDNIPFEKMWADDKHWLPLVLQEKQVKANFVFKEDNESIENMDLEETKTFN